MHEPLGKYVYQENTSDKWEIHDGHYPKQTNHEKVLHINYFIPCHKKYSGQHNVAYVLCVMGR